MEQEKLKVQAEENIIILPRGQVLNFLVGLNRYNLDIVKKLQYEFLDNDHSINIIRLRPNGVDSYISNDLKYCTKKFAHWNCSWIYISDHIVKMMKNDTQSSEI